MLLHFLKIFYNTKVLPLQSKLPAVSLTARQINYKENILISINKVLPFVDKRFKDS